MAVALSLGSTCTRVTLFCFHFYFDRRGFLSFAAGYNTLHWSLQAHPRVVEGDPGRPGHAVHEQREVSLLEGVLHCGQSPIQGFTEVEGAGPVQSLLHDPVRHPTQFHRLRQGGRNKWRRWRDS